jgi:hypothetical protein
MKVTDEMLMALADGELDRETAAEVTRAIEADPTLARRLQQFEATRTLAKAAFDSVLDEPVPERLIASVGTKPTWNLFRRTGRAPRTLLPVGLALAASIAGFVLGSVLTPGLPQSPSLLPDTQEIARLMEDALSGEARPWPSDGSLGGRFEVTASYAVPDGVCRTFSLGSPTSEQAGWQGVACHHGEAWNVELVVAGPRAGDDAFFSTASDRATQSIDSFLDAMGAGESLDATSEERLRTKGWRAEGGASPE